MRIVATDSGIPSLAVAGGEPGMKAALKEFGTAVRPEF
jgi:hypothetical protein